MHDYLLRFESQAQAEIAFPRPSNEPCWIDGALTIVPVRILMRAPEIDTIDDQGRIVPGTVPSPGHWLGIATKEPMSPRHPATIVEMARPDSPTQWRACIAWSALPDIAPVVAVSPVFAGSAYVFD